MTFPAVLAWNSATKTLRLLDQTRLPATEEYLDIRDTEALRAAIQRLSVRGAPAIGCAGAHGVTLAALECASFPAEQWQAEFEKRCERLADARPTAVNLRWAIERVKHTALELFLDGHGRDKIIAALEREALAVQTEDAEMCAAIGRYGAELLSGPAATIMTHCNAGALATAGSGTALAVVYAAQQKASRSTSLPTKRARSGRARA